MQSIPIPHDPFNDRVVASAGRYQAVHDQQNILLPDNQAIAIHRVRVDGVEDIYYRAVAHGDFIMVVFDLRDLAPSLWTLYDTPTTDIPGVILFTLRGIYPTAGQALARMFKKPVYTLQRVAPAAARPKAIATGAHLLQAAAS